MTIQPGSRGDFIVKCDGKLLWDKNKQGKQFPTEETILAMLAK